MSAIEKKKKKYKKKKEKMTALFRKWKKKFEITSLDIFPISFLIDTYYYILQYPPQFPTICVVNSFFTSVIKVYIS